MFLSFLVKLPNEPPLRFVSLAMISSRCRKRKRMILIKSTMLFGGMVEDNLEWLSGDLSGVVIRVFEILTMALSLCFLGIVMRLCLVISF